MNKERPEERVAKAIIERELGVALEHADKNGGADYRSLEGASPTIAVEVTRVTDEDVRKGMDAWRKADRSKVSGSSLKGCWLIFTAETTPGLKTYRQRLHPLIVQLEEAGIDSFDDIPAQIRAIEGGEHAELFRKLLQMRVERASTRPHEKEVSPDHVHRVIVSVGGGGSATDSDDAVALLTDVLALKSDNAKKLSESGADQRHLFVWIDGATPFAIERALSHGGEGWVRDDEDSGAVTDDAFGLPAQDPHLDPAISHLWVVHERSARGWLWSADLGWRALEGLELRDEADFA